VDQAALLGRGNELVGHHDAALRMPPAHQRLGADDRAVGQVHDRLVGDEELVTGHRRP
jgi:hypothetical protein